ncbi:hypothetical protein C9F11_35535 [Streptomyces sp. YIM 121038]|nr:hypothetical protein C9F11_35535 [Streptomyces sp. YIM 121038]
MWCRGGVVSRVPQEAALRHAAEAIEGAARCAEELITARAHRAMGEALAVSGSFHRARAPLTLVATGYRHPGLWPFVAHRSGGGPCPAARDRLRDAVRREGPEVEPVRIRGRPGAFSLWA